MKIGVAKEIKSDEYRVALTPAGARELADAGHEVFIEQGAMTMPSVRNEPLAMAAAMSFGL